MSVNEKQYLALRSFIGWGVNTRVYERVLTRDVKAEDGWVLWDVDLNGVMIRRERSPHGPPPRTQVRFVTWEALDSVDLVPPGPEDR